MSRTILVFLTTFILLSTYFSVLPSVFHMNDYVRFFHMLGFFPLAYGLSKLFNKQGLEAYGIVFFHGWRRNFFIGFAIGLIGWIVLFFLYFILGKFEFISFNFSNNSLMTIITILIGFGLGSFINDIFTRGVVFYHFKNKVSIKYVLLISLLLYTIDDIWYGGYSLQNIVFSLAIGACLTYAFYKTNSIWANTGIHFGLNVIYGIFFGVSGKVGDGLVLFKINTNDSFITMWLSSIITLIMLFLVYKMKHLFKNKL